jgi:hypothetical protein
MDLPAGCGLQSLNGLHSLSGLAVFFFFIVLYYNPSLFIDILVIYKYFL